MRVGSVCSGIEAATLAAPAHWVFDFYSEIEAFPSAVLHHRHGAGRPRTLPPRPNEAKALAKYLANEKAIAREIPAGDGRIPNLGDFTTITAAEFHATELLCGGPPCQSFSIAGQRGGLDDHRGNLTLEYVRIAHDLADTGSLRWAVYENVPGLLSDKTNAFGCFLSALVGGDDPLTMPFDGSWPSAGLVAGPRARVAWRVLDAQYFGLAQRRRRVIVVIGFADGCDPAKVLFERRGLHGNPPPRREPGQGFAADVERGPAVGGHWDGKDIHPTLNQSANTGGIGASNQEIFSQRGAGLVPAVTHTLRGEGFDASEDGTGRGTPLVPVVQHCAPIASTLNAAFGDKLGLEDQHINSGAPLFVTETGPIAFSSKDFGGDAMHDLSPTLRAGNDDTSHLGGGVPPAIAFNARQDPEVTGDRTGPLDASQPQAQAVAFAQNIRDEVHLIAGDGSISGALLASPGMKQQTYVATLAPTVTAGPPFSRTGNSFVETEAIVSEVKSIGLATSVTPKFAEELSPTLTTPSPSGGGQPMAVCTDFAVRRLTPIETARLQGFPDGFTDIPWNGKAHAPDGHQYKSHGNSWAVNKFRWLFERIDVVDRAARQSAQGETS
ncbi:DNA cytosine methyltransferase [Litorimonas sp. WD9-15]|uniref:DNA cytosine methyltransferase n=1 Tax=Litorimonas sp. WD9-15 TaxID=3418716 RepID=UPI003D01F0DF